MPDTLPTREFRVRPGWLSKLDAPSLDATGGWIYPHSPTTPYQSPGTPTALARYLLLDPRYKDRNGKAGKDEWWFIIERYWPSGYAPNIGDRDVNFHNVAGDAGNASGAPGGIGWAPGFGSGVSALALDFNNSACRQCPTFSVLTAWRSEGGFDCPVPFDRDVWNTYLVHWIAGRTDGSTVRPGLFEVWANGELVVSKNNINTVQRAKSPADGQMYVQRWMSLWEGQYTIHLNVETKKRIVLTRIGNTLDEAIADRPAPASDNPDNLDTLYQAYGNWPKTEVDANVPQRNPTDARLPNGDQPEPPTGDFKWQPQAPVVGETVTFSVIDPKSGVTYGWDRTLDGQLDATGLTTTYAYTQTGTKTMTLYADGTQVARHTLEVAAAPVDTLPLHLVRTDSSNIYLGWTPVPDSRGYTFWVNGTLVSRTNDPNRKEVKFAKKAGDVNEVRTLLDGPKGDWQQ